MKKIEKDLDLKDKIIIELLLDIRELLHTTEIKEKEEG